MHLDPFKKVGSVEMELLEQRNLEDADCHILQGLIPISSLIENEVLEDIRKRTFALILNQVYNEGVSRGRGWKLCQNPRLLQDDRFLGWSITMLKYQKEN